MKISNFKLTHRTGSNAANWKFKATVTVETGYFFKKTKTREVCKEFGSHWYFVDTGAWTPDGVEALVRKFEAETMISIERVKLQTEETT